MVILKDIEELNIEGLNIGLNIEGLNIGLNIEKLNIEGLNIEGLNIEGLNIEGLNIEGLNIEGLNIECTVCHVTRNMFVDLLQSIHVQDESNMYM